MDRLKFFRALHDAVNKYRANYLGDSDERTKVPLSREERLTQAMETAGLKTQDSNAANTIRTILFKCGKEFAEDPDPLDVLVAVEEAFVAWQRAETRKRRKKTASKKRPASMSAKKR